MTAARAAAAVVAAALAAMAAAAGCGRRPVPVDPTVRALYLDLERQVTVNAATGWGVDRLEIESILESSLDSVCRVEPIARSQLARWVNDQIAREGGPVDEAWRARGKDLAKVDDLLVLTRVQKLLARAEEVAGECPFWLEPEEPFRGRQISEGTWQLTFGGGGKGIVARQDDLLDLRFGGAGRLLFGRAFVGHAVYAGVELGASAAFPKDADGERSSLLLGVDIVAPVVYRRTLTNAYLELEAGWLGRATEQDWRALDHGIHVGAAIGARALRTRFLFPGAAIGISWERAFIDGPDLTTLKIGARVAFDLDL